jgi:hypothetical protein
MKGPGGEWQHRYWCYKDHYAITLLAVIDANYRFIYIDAGKGGATGDSQLFYDSDLMLELQSGRALPQSAGFPLDLPAAERHRPYLVGDAAFKQEDFLLKLIPGVHAVGSPEYVYNAAHCATRRVVENGFGHLKGAFMILSRVWSRNPGSLARIVRVCCALHNFRKLEEDAPHYTAEELAAGMQGEEGGGDGGAEATIEYLKAQLQL